MYSVTITFEKEVLWVDFHLIWQAILIVLVGTFLLRIAGRKTISQMTLAETVIMISLGTLLIQPVTGKNIWMTFVVAFTLVLTLVILQYLQIKSDFLEKIITGRSIVLIENGVMNEQNLMKSSMTVDQLEMMLRQNNITNISDVKWATLEPNGQLGILLKKEAQPVTKKEFQELQQSIHTLLKKQGIRVYTQSPTTKSDDQNIFTEIKQKGHKQKPPKHLQ